MAVAAEHVVLVVAAQDVLVGEDKRMGVGRAAGEGAVDPVLLIGNDVAGVVVGRFELVEQHERRVVVLEGIGNTVVGGVGGGRVGEVAADGEGVSRSWPPGGLLVRTAAGNQAAW